MIITSSASVTRPADTTQYGANELIANSTTAGSVVPLSFGVSKVIGGRGKIVRVSLFKDDETTTAASFKVHLFSASPTVTNGDNAAYAVSSVANYLGAVSIDMSTGATASTTDLWKDGTAAIYFDVSGGAVYGLIEAIGAYAPSSAEVFTVKLDIEG